MSIREKKFKLLVLLLFLFFMQSWVFPQSPEQAGKKYWIFFKDKNRAGLLKNVRKAAEQLDIKEKALKRRAKIAGKKEIINNFDIPVNPDYLQILKEMHLVPLARSRWLNAVSVFLPDSAVDRVESLSFVKKIKPVRTFIIDPPQGSSFLKPEAVGRGNIHSYDYGPSMQQNSLIRVPEVHDMGINGRGVLIGMIDAGFDYEDREVFSSIDIIAEHDFVWDDDTTANQGSEPSYQDDHGTQTLSVIGGFYEGNLIGPAFGASYMLAKTEWVPTETKIEEDNWVAGIEWMEREGVDIVSTSLGYSKFDDNIGYTYSDLNGDVCITTKAADIAAAKGVVVVASAGNERSDSWHYITSPADGDSVIAVGAVDYQGILTSFSSVGPTSDGRIKPDVVAMGSSIVAISPWGKDRLTYASGTSFSCPLTAGVCALVLQAHPELEPMQVRDAVRKTADRALIPDTLYGWGLVDSYKAIFYHGAIFKDFSKVLLIDEAYQGLEMDILWKYGIYPDSVYFKYKVSAHDQFTTVRMDPVDSEIKRFRAVFSLDIDLEKIKFYISMVDSFGNTYSGPVGAPDVLYEGISFITNDSLNIKGAVNLTQNYPNPYNPAVNEYTCFPIILSERSHVTMRIFNVLGQQVKKLFEGVLAKGEYENLFKWDGKDGSGATVASGIYLFRITVKGESKVCKIVLVN